MFDLITYSVQNSSKTFASLRKSFLFGFILALIFAALFLVLIKKGLGLSTPISLIAGGFSFFLFFTLVRIKFLVGPLVNQRLPTGVIPNFYNISGALNEREEPVYVDIGHLTERGNEIVAKKMVEILVTSDLLSTAGSPGRHGESMAEVNLK